MEQLPENIAIDETKKYINDLIDEKLWRGVIAEEDAVRNELRNFS